MTNSKQTPLAERLRSWPAANGQDGLNSSYVGALMVEAAEALEHREASNGLAVVAVDAGLPLLDRVIEVFRFQQKFLDHDCETPLGCRGNDPVKVANIRQRSSHGRG